MALLGHRRIFQRGNFLVDGNFPKGQFFLVDGNFPKGQFFGRWEFSKGAIFW